MSKLRMMALVGLMAAALSPLYGCGSECADGTTDKDGQCVVTAKGCSEGTALRSGECQLDTTGCGENTVFKDGLCMPAAEVCVGNTTFDEAEYTCVPNTDVICGEGTELGGDGSCVPDAEACSDKTILDDNGRCVIAAAACGEGTALDPNTGECLLAEAGCASGLALDATSGTCVPTADVCEVGTAFDADSGLCLNDSCNLGDVLIDGLCMLPAEDLATRADLTETENNDPALGGTAEILAVNPVDDDAYVFKGAIGAPADLDGDGTIDQDVDVFEFEANAGEWFEISVQSIGLQAPAFVVEGPENFLRYSPMGRARDAAREMVAPVDGIYTVTVLPSMVLQSDGAVTNFGSEDWTYVGTLQAVSAPAATAMDLSGGSAQITGDYADLGDNLFELTNLQPTDLVNISVASSGEDAVGLLQQWESANVLLSEASLRTGTSVDVSANSATSALLLFDWTRLSGPASTFDVTAKVVGSQQTLTMQPGTTETFTVSADTYNYVIARQSNPASADLDVTITDATGTEVDAGALSSGDEMRYLSEVPGDFTIAFTNSSASNVDATLTAKAVGLPKLGPLSLWGSDSYTSEGILPYGESRLHELTLAETGTLVASLVSSNSYDYTYVTLLDSTMTEVVPTGDRGLFASALAPGTYYVHVEPEYDDISYTLTVGLLGAPDFSSEPNVAIPDSTLPGVSDVLEVSGCTTVTSIKIYIDIAHSYRGDIVMSLTNPDGTSVLLHDGTGGGSDNLIGLYPDSLTSEEDINAFVGGSGDGEWTLTVGDEFSSDTGTLNEWGLVLGCQ